MVGAMLLARQIDIAAGHRHGVERVAADPVTPALIRHYDRRARDLRTTAQAAALRHLLRAPRAVVRVFAAPLRSAGPAAQRR